jgi:hypothetical protein
MSKNKNGANRKKAKDKQEPVTDSHKVPSISPHTGKVLRVRE